jgi:hypothetical protein
VEPAHCIFIARAAMKGRKMQEIQQDMLKLLEKSGIFQKKEI